MKSNGKLRLDVLVRTSQRDEGSASPKQQIDRCQRCADINGYVIAMVHDSGRSESGKTMDRASVRRAMERVRAGKTDGVMVAFLNRIGRPPIEESMATIRELHKVGKLVIADGAGQPVNLEDPQAETMLVIQLQIARQEWLTTAKRFAQNRKDAIDAGKAVGGLKWGYRYADPTPKRLGRGVVDSHLLTVERLRPLVKELFERKAAGASWLELARWLDRVDPLPDGRKWARQTVVGIIRSRTYLGEVRHGEFVQPDAHDALVSPALWRRAQNEPGHRTPRGNYLLSGLVRCAGCGRNMRASSGGVKKPAVFVCATPECPQRYTTAVVAHLDDEVVEQFFRRLEAFHLRPVDYDELAKARDNVDRVGGEVERLAMVTPSHPRAVRAHQEALHAAETALAEAEDILAGLESANAADGPDARELRAAWPTLSLDGKREILRDGIAAVLVRRAAAGRQGAGAVVAERIRVVFHDEAPADLMVRRGAVRSWTWANDPGSVRLAA
jgi:DNA invertase Pin-like site-specific DNA recombinase